jgi:hypothetical protein
MNKDVRTNLFEKAKIHTLQHNKDIPFEATFTNIELLIFPMGCVIVVIHIDWMPDQSKKLSISDVRTLLYVSKYRDKVSAVCNGWTFTDPSHDPSQSIPNIVKDSLGEDLYNSRFESTAISLKNLQKWIIKFTDNDTFSDDPMYFSPSYQHHLSHPHTPPEPGMSIFENTRHAFHHSTVVLEQEITGDVLNEYLYHMKRAFGQKNRPPSEAKLSTIGRILIWRKNRYIGISREGTVSVSWPSSQTDKDFEIHNWHKKFQGIYFLLSVYVWGERMVISELSDVAASQAEKLRLVDDDHMNLEEIRHSRNVMR